MEFIRIGRQSCAMTNRKLVSRAGLAGGGAPREDSLPIRLDASPSRRIGIAFKVMLMQVIHRLHPDQACECPALFMTWVAAALLSVLALRGAILASPAAPLETLAAAGLWALLLLAAGWLAIRRPGAATAARERR